MASNMTFNFTNRTDLIYCGFIQHALHNGHGIFERVRVHLSSNDALLLVAEISTVLVISLCIQILLKPFKQPRVISDMIAGLIIGPSFLGKYNEFSSLLFPERSKYMIQTMTQVAMMLFFFVNGIQMDITMIWKAKKRAYFIGLIGVFIPIMIMTIAIHFQKDYLDKYFPDKFKAATGLLTASVSVTSLHVLYPLLKELNLLETDIGRLSISCCMIADVVSFLSSIIAGLQRQKKGLYKFAYLSSYFGIICFCFSIIRPAAKLVNRRTPNGCQVKNVYVIIFLIGVMVTGFVADMFGSSVMQGPVMLALAIPEGPPLGAALVKRTEAVTANIFMPVLFAQVGLTCDVFAMNSWDWAVTKSLLEVVFIGYFAKFLSTMLVSFFFKIPIRDAISLGLVLSFRSQTEFSSFLRWKATKVLQQPAFTVLVLCTTVVTSTSTFLIRFIYIPTLSYMTNKPRTILHSRRNTKLNLVVCVHNQETVPALMDLLRASNPTKDNPVSVYVLQLVELIGKYRTIFINHNDKNTKFSNNDEYSSNVIWKALQLYKQTIGNKYISFYMFTSVSPYKIMYHEICRLALEKKASMIILPIHNDDDRGDAPLGTSSIYYASQLVNTDVMAHAPCSVGFLVGRDPKRNILLCDNTDDIHTMSFYRVIVLFLGGSDSREALAYADLMVSKKNVSLTVARFWPVTANNDSIICDDYKFHLEERLDQECFSWFVTKNLGNDRIVFLDFEVKNGVETIGAIREIDRNGYDLWMVGRERGMNPVFVHGITAEDWISSSSSSSTSRDHNHYQELGVIGDFISSPDFEGSFSVLVVQQQLQEKNVNYFDQKQE